MVSVNLRVMIIMSGCVCMDSECNSSQWQALVTSGSSLVYLWYINSKPIAVTTKNQVCRLITVYWLFNAKQVILLCGQTQCNMFICMLVHGQVTIIFVVSVGLSVCLSVCLFVQSFCQPSLIRFRSN